MTEERLSFQAEVSRLLSLMVNSVYSDKEVFVRELISNASDACDKLRYRAITEPEMIADDPEYRVQINIDKAARMLEFSDNGIGMNRDDLIENLGTIARSGTNAFVEALSADNQDNVSLIGQFGVGFYSIFMVADQVEVISRKAGEEEAWTWKSDGIGEFTIDEATREYRGTSVVIHLKDGEDNWLEKTSLTATVKKFADHIDLPILIAEGDEEAETVNQASAIWTRPKTEITEEQYKEFYHHVGHAYDDPWLTIHYRAEGKLEYAGLLFIPTQPPYDLFDPARKHRVKLYIKRVFITDDVEDLVPSYLRFLKGVIDTEDLALNISREMLQSNPLITHLRQAVTRRILTELKKKAKKSAEEYAVFWSAFGVVLKEGLYEDMERRDDLLELARFQSTAGDEITSLIDYVARMKENQSSIYYITGDDKASLSVSPHLEGYRARGLEVLLLSDPIDDFWLSTINDFDGKAFVSITRGGGDLSDIPLEESLDAEDEKDNVALDAEFATLIALLKTNLEGQIKDVRASDRLTDSAVCLVADDGDLDMQLERMLRAHGQLQQGSMRIMEINPRHPLVRQLAKRAGEDSSVEDLSDIANLLYDQARILEGEAVKDPAAFSRRLADVMTRAIAD
jgi:molecular chaperone HtpG